MFEGPDFDAGGRARVSPDLPPLAVKKEEAKPEGGNDESWFLEGEVLALLVLVAVFVEVLFLVTAATWASGWGGEGWEEGEESGSRERAGGACACVCVCVCARADADAGGDCDKEGNNDPECLSGLPAAGGVGPWADLRIDVGLRCCCFCCRPSPCAGDAAGFREGGESGVTGVAGEEGVWQGSAADGESVLDLGVVVAEDEVVAGVGVKRCGSSELAALGEPPGEEGGRPGEDRLRGAAVGTAVSGW